MLGPHTVSDSISSPGTLYCLMAGPALQEKTGKGHHNAYSSIFINNLRNIYWRSFPLTENAFVVHFF